MVQNPNFSLNAFTLHAFILQQISAMDQSGAKVVRSNDVESELSVGNALENIAQLSMDNLLRNPNNANAIEQIGSIAQNWMNPKYKSLADIPENDQAPFINWDRLTETEFATKMITLFQFKNTLIFTQHNCYLFALGDISTNADVMGIVCQWRTLGSKRTELYRYFDFLFNYYFGAFKKIKTNKSEKEANEIFRILLKLDTPSFRTSILKNLEVMLYRPEYDIEWNKHSNWFVFTDRIVDLNTGLDVEPHPEQYINMSCGHAGNPFLIAFDGLTPHNNDQLVEEATTNITNFMLDITGGDERSYEMADYMFKIMSTFLFQGNVEEKCYFLLGE